MPMLACTTKRSAVSDIVAHHIGCYKDMIMRTVGPASLPYHLVALWTWKAVIDREMPGTAATICDLKESSLLLLPFLPP